MLSACCNPGVDALASPVMERFWDPRCKVADSAPFYRTNALGLAHRTRVEARGQGQNAAAT